MKLPPTRSRGDAGKSYVDDRPNRPIDAGTMAAISNCGYKMPRLAARGHMNKGCSRCCYAADKTSVDAGYHNLQTKGQKRVARLA